MPRPPSSLGTMVCWFVIARARLGRMGEERVVANREKHRIVAEAMGGIKTVKLMGLERSYIAQFQAPAAELARSQAALAIISELPRHLLEVIAFGGMILFVLWLLATQGSMAEVVPPPLARVHWKLGSTVSTSWSVSVKRPTARMLPVLDGL